MRSILTSTRPEAASDYFPDIARSEKRSPRFAAMAARPGLIANRSPAGSVGRICCRNFVATPHSTNNELLQATNPEQHPFSRRYSSIVSHWLWSCLRGQLGLIISSLRTAYSIA